MNIATDVHAASLCDLTWLSLSKKLTQRNQRPDRRSY
jgi:hypothetical protein